MAEVVDETRIERIVKARSGAKQWGNKFSIGLLLDEGKEDKWYNLYEKTQEEVQKKADEIEIGGLYSFKVDDKNMIIDFRKSASANEIPKKEPEIKTASKREPLTQDQVRREACINSAIAFHSAIDPATSIEGILKTAEQFENWVLR